MQCNATQRHDCAEWVLQGMAERISLPQPGSTAFYDALLKVLTEARYTRAAQELSVKVRAHKRTPVQQAAGERRSECLQRHPRC
jgi:hypothetical protein